MIPMTWENRSFALITSKVGWSSPARSCPVLPVDRTLTSTAGAVSVANTGSCDESKTVCALAGVGGNVVPSLLPLQALLTPNNKPMANTHSFLFFIASPFLSFLSTAGCSKTKLGARSGRRSSIFQVYVTQPCASMWRGTASLSRSQRQPRKWSPTSGRSCKVLARKCAHLGHCR